MQNKLTEAKAQFEKANGIQENPVSKNNLAAIAGVNGDRQKAKDLLAEADGAGSEVSYNKGVLRSEEHTSELQSRPHLVCRLLLEKKKLFKTLFHENTE